MDTKISTRINASHKLTTSPVVVRNHEAIELAGGLARQELFSIVRFLLNSSKIKQQDVADALGVNKSIVSRMLSSPRNLTVTNAGRVLGVLGYWLHFNPQPAGATVAAHGAFRRNVDVDELVVGHHGDAVAMLSVSLHFPQPSSNSTPRSEIIAGWTS